MHWDPEAYKKYWAKLGDHHSPCASFSRYLALKWNMVQFSSFFFKKTLIKLLPENSSHLGWDKTSYPLRSWCYHFFLHGQGKCIFLDACRALHYHWMFWMKQRAKLSCPLPKKNLDRALTLSCPETECHIIQYVEVLKRKLFKL